MPHTPKTLFGKPPLSVSSPLSSFGMEEGCRMGKRIRACPPPHMAPAGLCLSWTLQPLPAPKSNPPQAQKAPTFWGKAFSCGKNSDNSSGSPVGCIQSLTSGMIGEGLGLSHAGVGPQG